MKKQLLICALICTAAVTVFAQGSYDIKEMTPVVKAALDGRKGRVSALRDLKTKGVVGETNRGYVQALGGGKDVDATVAAENKDRKLIYETIVEQHKLSRGALITVEEAFGRIQRGKAEPGDKVQDASGRWN